MSAVLTEAVLHRLSSQALLAYFGHAPQFEFSMHPGCASLDSGMPVADLNYVVAGQGANHDNHFADACRTFLSRDVPFLAIVFPGSGTEVDATARDLGLAYVVDFPFMVRDDTPVEPEGNASVFVRRATGIEDVRANARVLGSAFGMPEDVAGQVLPASLFDAPNVDTYLASIDGDVVGSVTLVHHGDVTGVWSMATDTARQRSGIGRRLLSTAMAEARSRGTTSFYLGATPAGQRLYESLGFTTRTTARVWVSGETHQA